VNHKIVHIKTTHLQRQIALIMEKREKNHIPKEQCPQQLRPSPPAYYKDCWLPRGTRLWQPCRRGRSCSAHIVETCRRRKEGVPARGGEREMTDEGEEALPPWCKGRRRAEKERKRACRRPPTADLAAWWPDLMLPAAVWPGSGGGDVGRWETVTGVWGRQRAETGPWGCRRRRPARGGGEGQRPVRGSGARLPYRLWRPPRLELALLAMEGVCLEPRRQHGAAARDGEAQ
jgi:hypothetical protein